MKERECNGRKQYFYVEEKQTRESVKKRKWSAKEETPMLKGSAESTTAAFEGMRAKAARFDEGGVAEGFGEPASASFEQACTDVWDEEKVQHSLKGVKPSGPSEPGPSEPAPSEASSSKAKRPKKEITEKDKVNQICCKALAFLQKLQLSVKSTWYKIKDNKYCLQQSKEMTSLLSKINKDTPWWENECLKTTITLESANKCSELASQLDNEFKTLRSNIPRVFTA